MIEKDLAIPSEGGTLSGTVCLPAGTQRVPLVLMVHGTGPLDRDGNMKGQNLDVFNTIAHHLALHGIGSLRYDKRGCGRSSGDYHAAGHSDLVNDAVNWVDALAREDFCDPRGIVVLGHSEGCIIAPQVSIRRPSVAGLILLCPFVDRMESILLKQAEQVQREFAALPGLAGRIRRFLSGASGIVASQQKLIARLTEFDTDTLRVGFQKIPAKSLRELLRLDPPAIFSKVTCPMLLIGGGKDLQCDPADLGRIAELAQGAVRQHVIPDLTHMLRATDEQPSILRRGMLLSKPVEPAVLGLIAAWLGEQGG